MAKQEQTAGIRPLGKRTCWTIGVVTLVVAQLLLYRSLFCWQMVTTEDAVSHIPMGLPFPFLSQDQSWYHSGKIPMRTRFLAPQEFVTHMIWPNYFLDLALVWGSLLLITLLILWVIRKVRRAYRTGS